MLERFLEAQEGSYKAALAELKAGRKRGCWIWWVLPQRKGLGSSEYSVFYGIQDDAEAEAYLRHPVLGVRYLECIETVHQKLCQEGVDPLVLMGKDIDVLSCGRPWGYSPASPATDPSTNPSAGKPRKSSNCSRLTECKLNR